MCKVERIKRWPGPNYNKITAVRYRQIRWDNRSCSWIASSDDGKIAGPQLRFPQQRIKGFLDKDNTLEHYLKRTNVLRSKKRYTMVAIFFAHRADVPDSDFVAKLIKFLLSPTLTPRCKDLSHATFKKLERILCNCIHIRLSGGDASEGLIEDGDDALLLSLFWKTYRLPNHISIRHRWIAGSSLKSGHLTRKIRCKEPVKKVAGMKSRFGPENNIAGAANLTVKLFRYQGDSFQRRPDCGKYNIICLYELASPAWRILS